MWHVTVIYPGNQSEVFDFNTFDRAASFSKNYKNARQLKASSPWHDDATIECATYKAIEERNQAVLKANSEVEWF